MNNEKRNYVHSSAGYTEQLGETSVHMSKYEKRLLGPAAEADGNFEQVITQEPALTTAPEIQRVLPRPFEPTGEFLEGQFFQQAAETGKIDRKKTTKESNERLAKILKEAQFKPRPKLLTADDTVPILRRAAEKGKQYLATQVEKPLDSTISPDKKQVATELRDLINQRIARIDALNRGLIDILSNIPENQREQFWDIITVIGDDELTRMSDAGKTAEAVWLIDDQEGMLQLYSAIAKQLLNERNERIAQAERDREKKNAAELSDQPDKAPKSKQPEQLPEEVMPKTIPERKETIVPEEEENTKSEQTAEAIKAKELSPEKKKAIEDIVDKKLKEKSFVGKIKRGFRALKKFIKAAWKNPTVRRVALVSLGVAGTLTAVGILQNLGYLLPVPINHVFTADGVTYILK